MHRYMEIKDNVFTILMHHWLHKKIPFYTILLKEREMREDFERTESSPIIAIKEYWLSTKCVGMCHFGSHQWWNCLHYDTWLSQSKPNRHISYFESVFRSQKVAASPEIELQKLYHYHMVLNFVTKYWLVVSILENRGSL